MFRINRKWRSFLPPSVRLSAGRGPVLTHSVTPKAKFQPVKPPMVCTHKTFHVVKYVYLTTQLVDMQHNDRYIRLDRQIPKML